MITLSRTSPTWTALVAAEPRLKQFERATAEAGRNGVRDYVTWLTTYKDFQHCVGTAASNPAMRSREAWECAILHLTDVFNRAARKGGRK
jgi:hypothetical protein